MGDKVKRSSFYNPDNKVCPSPGQCSSQAPAVPKGTPSRADSFGTKEPVEQADIQFRILPRDSKREQVRTPVTPPPVQTPPVVEQPPRVSRGKISSPSTESSPIPQGAISGTIGRVTAKWNVPGSNRSNFVGETGEYFEVGNDGNGYFYSHNDRHNQYPYHYKRIGKENYLVPVGKTFKPEGMSTRGNGARTTQSGTRATSRYEDSLETLLDGNQYPKRGNVFSSGEKKYFISGDGTSRKFVQLEDKKYYQIDNNGNLVNSKPYTHYQHGDQRIMNYLLPENAIPFPRSMPRDFSTLPQTPSAFGDGEPLGRVEIDPRGTTIVIPEALRKPGEDGIISFNIGQRGITRFDNEEHGPGSPSYLFWNHETAEDMLKDAGIDVVPKFSSQGKKLRSVEIEFHNKGTFEIRQGNDSTKFKVDENGVTVLPKAKPPARKSGTHVAPRTEGPTVSGSAPGAAQPPLPPLAKEDVDAMFGLGTLKTLLNLISDEDIVESIKKLPNEQRVKILGTLSESRSKKIIQKLPPEILLELQSFFEQENSKTKKPVKFASLRRAS